MSAQPVDVLETLAAWANEKGIGRDEWKRRSDTVAVVTDLIETARGVKFDVYALATPELREVFDGCQSIAVVQLATVKPFRDALSRCGGGAP